MKRSNGGKKVRVAHLTTNLRANGITNVVLSYCGNIPANAIGSTVITASPVDDIAVERCRELGVRLIVLPDKTKDPAHFFPALMKEVSGKKYDIVHVHGNSATITAELMICLLRGVKVRIAHAHSVTCDHMKAHKLLWPLFCHTYTKGFACSTAAGKWLFRDRPFTVLPNAFDTRRFIFDPEKREEVRTRSGLQDRFVIGAVSRLNVSKNYPYLLQIFEAAAKTRPDLALLIAGDGPEREHILSMIAEHPFKDRIVYYGNAAHPEDVFSAVDAFVLPTQFEGLGIVFLEAQISGLPCLASDAVPRDVVIDPDAISFLPLTKDPTPWADAIIKMKPNPAREAFYEAHLAGISRFEITDAAKKLADVYQKLASASGRKHK